MRFFVFIYFLFFLSIGVSAQVIRSSPDGGGSGGGSGGGRGRGIPRGGSPSDTVGFFKGRKVDDKVKAPVDLYKIYTVERDTTFLDTSLTIKKEYQYNLLRKDIFGLLPFANEGHTYNTLDFNAVKKSVFPNFGFTAKHFNYLETNDIRYFNVPTPLTDLYYKTVMGQGQSLDALLTVNPKPNFNLSLAYKGLRSLGHYINNLTSSGNFRLTTSYFSKNKRYVANAHFTSQDILNQENGGIIDNSSFASSQEPFNQRQRIAVHFSDAVSVLEGKRFYLDHNFKLSKKPNSLMLYHQFNGEKKFFDFSQTTESERFGNTSSSVIQKATNYNHLYNKAGAGFLTEKFGYVMAFAEHTNYNYFYNSVIYDDFGSIAIPNKINDQITAIGGDITFDYKGVKLHFLASNTITNQSLMNVEANAEYHFNENANIKLHYQRLNSLPNLNYNLYQSGYTEYNWRNDFKNEKRNQLRFSFQSKWLNLEANYTVLDDYLYFSNTSADSTKLIVKPFQYDRTINYMSFKAEKEFKVGKFALDNTVLYQTVTQTDNILNVPKFVVRQSFYLSDNVFKKAMFLQTGFIFNYFTGYYANGYNPLIGEFYVQQEQKIGNFPMLDFFVNAKVRQCRIFLKAEHLNSKWTGYNFYSAPDYPYRDFMIRFGLVWNFFK